MPCLFNLATARGREPELLERQRLNRTDMPELDNCRRRGSVSFSSSARRTDTRMKYSGSLSLRVRPVRQSDPTNTTSLAIAVKRVEHLYAIEFCVMDLAGLEQVNRGISAGSRRSLRSTDIADADGHWIGGQGGCWLFRCWLAETYCIGQRADTCPKPTSAHCLLAQCLARSVLCNAAANPRCRLKADTHSGVCPPTPIIPSLHQDL